MNSIFNSQMQSAMMQILLKWMEMYAEKTSGQDSTITADTQTSNTIQDNSSSGNISTSFADLIQEASEKYGVDEGLISAVIQAESNFDADAVSSAGALGLMQLMPATANSLGVSDPLDPEQNINGGTKLLSQLLDLYNGNTSLALAAYNAGPGAVATYGGIPPYQETQTYVQRVLQLWQ
jgi:soluble lytic murein transglycosylase-like protein